MSFFPTQSPFRLNSNGLQVFYASVAIPDAGIKSDRIQPFTIGETIEIIGGASSTQALETDQNNSPVIIKAGPPTPGQVLLITKDTPPYEATWQDVSGGNPDLSYLINGVDVELPNAYEAVVEAPVNFTVDAGPPRTAIYDLDDSPVVPGLYTAPAVNLSTKGIIQGIIGGLALPPVATFAPSYSSVVNFNTLGGQFMEITWPFNRTFIFNLTMTTDNPLVGTYSEFIIDNINVSVFDDDEWGGVAVFTLAGDNTDINGRIGCVRIEPATGMFFQIPNSVLTTATAYQVFAQIDLPDPI